MSAVSTTSTLLPPLPKFNGTCVPVQYPCYPGTLYIDPCDCKFYYSCRNTGSIVRLACSRGTAYDHTSRTAFCQPMAKVVGKGKCYQAQLWDRCLDRHSTADLPKLRSWCTSSGYLTPPTPRRGGDDDVNAGAIAAIVIIVLLLIVVIVLAVVYVRKKGNPLPKIKETSFWQNLTWCWREIICWESDGSGYYYDDDNDEERAQGGGEGGGGGADNANQRPPLPGNRAEALPSKNKMGEEGEEEGTYHEFGEEKMERRKSYRGSLQETISEDPHCEAAAAAVYDNPAFDPNCPIHDDDDDAPPPDTELSPAPPPYSKDEHLQNRHLKQLVHDAELIETSFEDDVVFPVSQPRITARSSRSQAGPGTARSTRSLSVPATFQFGDDSGSASDSSYVA